MNTVHCALCLPPRRVWARIWLRHCRRRHGGVTIMMRREVLGMGTTHEGFDLVGTARCSEAEPQCIDVFRDAEGNVLLDNRHGRVLPVPANEVEGLKELL